MPLLIRQGLAAQLGGRGQVGLTPHMRFRIHPVCGARTLTRIAMAAHVAAVGMAATIVQLAARVTQPSTFPLVQGIVRATMGTIVTVTKVATTAARCQCLLLLHRRPPRRHQTRQRHPTRQLTVPPVRFQLVPVRLPQ